MRYHLLQDFNEGVFLYGLFTSLLQFRWLAPFLLTMHSFIQHDTIKYCLITVFNLCGL